MIDPEIIIKIEGENLETKLEVINILRQNYEKVLNDMILNANYITLTHHWDKDYIPHNEITNAQKFINKYGN